jgi:hypothetical protein
MSRTWRPKTNNAKVNFSSFWLLKQYLKRFCMQISMNALDRTTNVKRIPIALIRKVLTSANVNRALSEMEYFVKVCFAIDCLLNNQDRKLFDWKILTNAKSKQTTAAARRFARTTSALSSAHVCLVTPATVWFVRTSTNVSWCWTIVRGTKYAGIKSALTSVFAKRVSTIFKMIA